MTTAASVQQSANGHLATGECQPKRTNTVFTMLALLLSTALYFILLEIYFHYYLTYPRLTKSSTTPSTCPRRRLSDCRQLRRHVHVGDSRTADSSVDILQSTCPHRRLLDCRQLCRHVDDCRQLRRHAYDCRPSVAYIHGLAVLAGLWLRTSERRSVLKYGKRFGT